MAIVYCCIHVLRDNGFLRCRLDESYCTFPLAMIAETVRYSREHLSLHSFVRPSLRELPMTETELKLMAAAAIIGLSSSPNTG